MGFEGRFGEGSRVERKRVKLGIDRWQIGKGRQRRKEVGAGCDWSAFSRLIAAVRPRWEETRKEVGGRM